MLKNKDKSKFETIRLIVINKKGWFIIYTTIPEHKKIINHVDGNSESKFLIFLNKEGHCIHCIAS